LSTVPGYAAAIHDERSAAAYASFVVPAPDGANLARCSPIGGRLCVRCGKSLVTLWWVTTYPDGEHEECRDFSAHDFPYARQVKGLRRLWREVAGEDRAALTRVDTALVALEQRWPSDALHVLREGRALIAEARAVVTELPPRLRALL